MFRPQKWLLLVLCAAYSGCTFVRGPPKDGECRANLRTALSLELSYRENTGAFTPHPAFIGFSPSAGNRYLYWFAATGPISRRDGKPSPSAQESVGIGPDFSRGEILESVLKRIPSDILKLVHAEAETMVIGCAGNIDADDTLDIWTISSEDRSFNGQSVSRGTAFRHVDDHTE
jgi:type IV pilus assembly protein PilA